MIGNDEGESYDNVTFSCVNERALASRCKLTPVGSDSYRKATGKGNLKITPNYSFFWSTSENMGSVQW